MNHSEYIALGRLVATSHKDIAHIEGDMDNLHFARIVLSADPMGSDNIEEFLQSIRNDIKFPFLLWQAYDHSYRNDRGDNIQKVYQGAFIVLMNPEKGNYQQEEASYDQAEKLGEDIISFIKKDFSTKLSSRFIFVDEVSAEKLGPVYSNFIGVRFNFSFQKTANSNFHYNPANWL